MVLIAVMLSAGVAKGSIPTDKVPASSSQQFSGQDPPGRVSLALVRVSVIAPVVCLVLKGFPPPYIQRK